MRVYCSRKTHDNNSLSRSHSPTDTKDGSVTALAHTFHDNCAFVFEVLGLPIKICINVCVAFGILVFNYQFTTFCHLSVALRSFMVFLSLFVLLLHGMLVHYRTLFSLSLFIVIIIRSHYSKFHAPTFLLLFTFHYLHIIKYF